MENKVSLGGGPKGKTPVSPPVTPPFCFVLFF